MPPRIPGAQHNHAQPACVFESAEHKWARLSPWSQSAWHSNDQNTNWSTSWNAGGTWSTQPSTWSSRYRPYTNWTSENWRHDYHDHDDNWRPHHRHDEALRGEHDRLVGRRPQGATRSSSTRHTPCMYAHVYAYASWGDGLQVRRAPERARTHLAHTSRRAPASPTSSSRCASSSPRARHFDARRSHRVAQSCAPPPPTTARARLTSSCADASSVDVA